MPDNSTSDHISNGSLTSPQSDGHTDAEPKKRKHSPWVNALRITALSLVGIVASAIILLVAATFWLTPHRLSEIVAKECKRNLDAQVTCGDIDWTFWSSFPVLTVATDSLTLISNSLSALPDDIRHTLPSDADTLINTGKIRFSINPFKAIAGKILLNEVLVASPRVNIVTVNDSVANYKIVKEHLKPMRIKSISLDTLIMPGSLMARYTSIGDSIHAQIAIPEMNIKSLNEPGAFHVGLLCKTSVSSPAISMKTPLAVNIDGIVKVRNQGKEVALENFHTEVPGLKTVTDLRISTAGKTIVESLSCRIQTGNLFAALTNLPIDIDKMGLSGMLSLNVSLSLLKPYELSSPQQFSLLSLPMFAASVTSDEGSLTIPTGRGRSTEISGMEMLCELVSNNEAGSNIKLRHLKFTADGANVDVTGKAEGIGGNDPQISADLSCSAPITSLLKLIPGTGTISGSGTAAAKVKVSSGIADIDKITGLTSLHLKNLKIDGIINSRQIAIVSNNGKSKGNISGLSIDIKGDVPELEGSNIYVNSIGVAVSADKSIWLTPASRISLGKTSLLADAAPGRHNLSENATGFFSFTTDSLNVEDNHSRMKAHSLSISLKGKTLSSPRTVKEWKPDSSRTTDDALIAARVKHSPLYLTFTDAPLLSTLNSLDLIADIAIADGEFTNDAYPSRNLFGNVSVSTDLDSVTIRNIDINTRHMAAALSGKVTNLRDFLTSSSPVPLYADLSARFNDVDINKLAGIYYEGVAKATGKPVDFSVPKPGKYTASDSLCVVIPRNLFAKVNLHADKAEYMQWHFAPLSTELSVNDGVAKIGNLNIGSDFCTVNVDWTYSTRNLDDIRMLLKADIDDFDLSNFFRAFPSLAKGTPQLSNLSGVLSADAEGEFLMYPDMFVNAPSMTATATVDGDSIAFARDRKVADITHFLLLKGDGPLHLDPFSISAVFHDNLLEVRPFTLRCGKYELLGGGVNNLQGELYYHLGILHTPVLFPFGVNIVGNWHHPSVRFGGRWIKDGREREISANLADNVNVNIMRELKHGWLLFIENAAKYDYANNHDYVFNVP